jgi:hypothetical protein
MRFLRHAGLCGILGISFFGTHPAVLGQTIRPQPRKPPLTGLSVEHIYGEPSLSGRRLDGIAWAPDGKRVSFFKD